MEKERRWKPSQPDLVITDVSFDRTNASGELTCEIHRLVPEPSPPQPLPYGRVVDARLDKDTGEVVWTEEVEVDTGNWFRLWLDLVAKPKELANATTERDRDRVLREALEHIHAAQDILKWKYEKDPSSSEKFPGEPTFWAYRNKWTVHEPWVQGLQWMRNLLHHAGAFQAWDEDERGNLVWAPSERFPLGKPAFQTQPHYISGKRAYDERFHNTRTGKGSGVVQLLSYGAQFILDVGRDLGLELSH